MVQDERFIALSQGTVEYRNGAKRSEDMPRKPLTGTCSLSSWAIQGGCWGSRSYGVCVYPPWICLAASEISYVCEAAIVMHITTIAAVRDLNATMRQSPLRLDTFCSDGIKSIRFWMMVILHSSPVAL